MRVFWWARKIGSNGKSFPLTIKYALWPYKTISVCILPSNEFRPRKIEERERNSKLDPTSVRSHPSTNEIAPIGAATQAKPDRVSHKPDRLHPSSIHPKPISSSTHPRPSLFSTHQWSLDRCPQPTAPSSCMQPRFGSDRLLTIWLPPPMTDLVIFSLDLVVVAAGFRSTHPWLIASISFSICLSFFLNHSLFLPPSLSLTEDTVFDEWFFVLSFVFLSLYIEIFYYKICWGAEKMWKTCRK